MYEFAILGPLAVSGPLGPIGIDGSRRRAILIRLLLAQGGPVSLERLSEDVWSGNSTGGTASTLRSHLSLLRKVLPLADIRSRNGSVVMEPSSLSLDSTRFELLVESGHRGLAAGRHADAEERFARSLELWHGPALVDVDGYEWSRPDIVRLHEGQLAAQEGLLESRLQLGQFDRVISDAGAAVSEYPLRERRWSTLMRALYKSGRQADALRAYQRLRSLLDDQLGIAPTVALQELEIAILSQDESLSESTQWYAADPSDRIDPSVGSGTSETVDTDTGTGTDSGPEQSADLAWIPAEPTPDLVGRQAAIDRVMSARNRALGGKTVLVVVTGEPGIGKTRLASEVAVKCQGLGDLIMYGRCGEESLSAYQGFRQSLGHVLGHPAGRSALEEIGVLAGPLRQVVPESGIENEPSEPFEFRPLVTERYPSFESVAAFMQALASRRSLLWVLEDWHWADSPSVLLLEHLMQSHILGPITIVLTCRDTDQSGQDWLTHDLVGIRRIADVERIDLSGLSAGEALDLLQGILGDDGLGGETDGAHLYDYTGGNPFFVQEIALDVATQEQSNRQWFAPHLPFRGSVPDRLREVVQWRLRQLSGPCKQVLSIASMIGFRFDLDVVGELSDLGEQELLAAVDEAVLAGVIIEDPSGGNALQFTHDLVRHALQVGLGSSRRVRMHRQIAYVLKETFGSDASRAAEVAMHFVLGVNGTTADDAMAFSAAAGHHARSESAYEDAISHFRQALDIGTSFRSDDASGKSELLLQMADAMVKVGNIADADQSYSEAFALGDRIDRIDVLCSAALGYGGVLPAGAEPNPTAEAQLLTVLDRLGTSQQIERALALGRLAQWGHFSIPRARRIELCEESIRTAQDVGDPRALAACLENRYWALCGPEDVEGQLGIAQRIEVIGREESDPELILRGMKCQLHTDFESGEFERATELARDMKTLAEEIRQPEYLRLGFMWDSLVAGVQGRFDVAEAAAQEAFAIFRRGGHSQERQIAVGLSLTWHWLQDRLNEFAPILDAGQTGRESLGELALAGWIAVESEQHDRAREILDSITPDRVLCEERNFHWWFGMVGLSQVACGLEDEEWAGRLYELVLPFESHSCRVGQATFLGSAHYYLGRLAAVMGNSESAEAHLRESLLRHSAMEAGPFVELSRTALASVSTSTTTRDRRPR